MVALPKPNWKSERPYMPNAWVGNEQSKRYQFCMPYCQDKVVLDLFCGDGFGSEILSTTASKVCGTDYSREAIDYANAQHKKDNIEFRVEKFPPIGFENNTFDTVVSLEAIEHIEDDDLYCQEIKRVLKDNGIFIVCTPIKEGQIGAWHIREYKKIELIKLLNKHFKLEKFYHPPPFAHTKQIGVCRNE